MTFKEAVVRISELYEARNAELLEIRLVKSRRSYDEWLCRAVWSDGTYCTHFAQLWDDRLPGFREDLLLFGKFDMTEDASKLDLRSRG